jgi:hypothetical protein
MVELLLNSLVFLMAVVAVWLACRAILNHLAGLRLRLRVDTGPVLRKSRWGDADVNGVGFQNCVRVVECTNGWLLQVRLIGGRLWLPRAQTRIEELEHVGQFGPYRRLQTSTDHVKLEGELAEFIAKPVNDLRCH